MRSFSTWWTIWAHHEHLLNQAAGRVVVGAATVGCRELGAVYGVEKR